MSVYQKGVVTRNYVLSAHAEKGDSNVKQSPKTLTTLECHQLLDKLICRQGTPRQFWLGVRNYTIAILMLDAGLRVGEVVQLKIPDLRFKKLPMNALLIHSEIAKNKTERTVPLSSRIQNAIMQMSETVWPPPDGNYQRYAFYETLTTKPLTTRQVERVIEKASVSAFGRKVTPHALRHTFATKIMRVTNARTLQELLGHKQLSSTQIYTHPNEQDKKNAIQDATCEEQDRISQRP